MKKYIFAIFVITAMSASAVTWDENGDGYYTAFVPTFDEPFVSDILEVYLEIYPEYMEVMMRGGPDESVDTYTVSRQNEPGIYWSAWSKWTEDYVQAVQFYDGLSVQSMDDGYQEYRSRNTENTGFVQTVIESANGLRDAAWTVTGLMVMVLVALLGLRVLFKVVKMIR